LQKTLQTRTLRSYSGVPLGLWMGIRISLMKLVALIKRPTRLPKVQGPRRKWVKHYGSGELFC
jgi:hypothetical protein